MKLLIGRKEAEQGTRDTFPPSPETEKQSPKTDLRTIKSSQEKDYYCSFNFTPCAVSCGQLTVCGKHIHLDKSDRNNAILMQTSASWVRCFQARPGTKYTKKYDRKTAFSSFTNSTETSIIHEQILFQITSKLKNKTTKTYSRLKIGSIDLLR